jgi:hypothetical protein
MSVETRTLSHDPLPYQHRTSASLMNLIRPYNKTGNWTVATLALVLALCGPAGAQDQGDGDDKPYKYTGNLYSHKFHRPSCPYCRVMAIYKRTRFHFRHQAVAAGYVPCRYCLPPVWTTVRAVIKCQDNDNNSAPGISENQNSADKSSQDTREEAPLGTPVEQSNICKP